MFRIDDILAALFLSLAMLRRLETKRASHEAYPAISAEDFAHALVNELEKPAHRKSQMTIAY